MLWYFMLLRLLQYSSRSIALTLAAAVVTQFFTYRQWVNGNGDRSCDAPLPIYIQRNHCSRASAATESAILFEEHSISQEY